jgi:hypothetical protein
MSAPAPHLALVPPDPPLRTGKPFLTTPERAARVRRIFLGLAFVGTALPPVATLLGPFIGEWRVAVYVLCFVALVPTSALVLGIGLLVSRTMADLRACLVGLLALVACRQLTAAARDASLEVFVASRQADLDRLAVDVRAFDASLRATGMKEDSVWVETSNHFAPREQALGVSSGALEPGWVGFMVNGGADGREIDYAFAGGAPRCRRGTVRFLGGHWFERRCLSDLLPD